MVQLGACVASIVCSWQAGAARDERVRSKATAAGPSTSTSSLPKLRRTCVHALFFIDLPQTAAARRIGVQSMMPLISLSSTNHLPLPVLTWS